MHRRVKRLVLAVGSLACAFGANARGDWVVRQVAVGANLPPANVDVMVNPEGRIVTGYALPTSSTGGELWVSTLGEGPFFEHARGPTSSVAASFAMDRFGNISYVTRQFDGGPVRFGADLRGWGQGFVESPITLPRLPTMAPGVAVNSHGIPAMAAVGTPSCLFQFDPIAAEWRMDSSLPARKIPDSTITPVAFDEADRPVVAFIDPERSALVIARGDLAAWQTFSLAAKWNPSIGMAGGANGVGIAYIDSAGLAFVRLGEALLDVERIVPTMPTQLIPGSVAYDPAGRPAVAFALTDGKAPGPLYLARRDDAGEWSTELMPARGLRASVTFDQAGRPIVAAVTPVGIELLGQDLAALVPGDFGLDGAFGPADLSPLVQAMRRQPSYLAGHPGASPADMLTMGDVTSDWRFDAADARRLAEQAVGMAHVRTLRQAISLLDEADADPRMGSGAGNFFGAMLSTGAPYQPGDSAADLSGPSAGEPDGRIDAFDIDWVISHAGQPAPFCDINADGLVNTADADRLIREVLLAIPGDANLDGIVDGADYLQIDAGFLRGLAGYAQGDFDHDRQVTGDDYFLLDRAYLGGDQAAVQATPEPLALPLGFSLLLLLRRPRRKAAAASPAL